MTKPDVNKIKAKRDERKAARSDAIRAGMANGRSNTDPDWDEIEGGGEPKLTFAPSVAKRIKMVEVLERPAKDPERRQLQTKLTREFVRIYKRYRRVYHPTYALSDSEDKHAAEAARLCILKGVTPRQLIEYWHNNVGNFTGMKFPTLTFLSSAGNVDRAAVDVTVDETDHQQKRTSAPGNVEGPKIHAYGPSGIDKRLRHGLESAGFDTTQFSDRHLMSIQQTAKSVAEGHRLFIPSKLKPMIEWAAQNLYSNAK